MFLLGKLDFKLFVRSYVMDLELKVMWYALLTRSLSSMLLVL